MTDIAHHPGTLSAARARPAPPASSETLLAEAQRLRNDDPLEALRVLEDLRTPGMRHADPGMSGMASMLRAQVLGDLGQYEGATGAIQSARHDLLSSGRMLYTYGADLVRGKLIRLTGDPARAIDVIDGVLTDLPDVDVAQHDRLDLSRLRAHSHRQLGLAKAAAADHRGALRQLDLAWNRFHALGDPVMTARTSAERAASYLELDMTHRAMDDLDRSRDVLLSLGHVLDAARCAIPLSKALVRLDRIPEAVLELDDVRPIFEQRGHRHEVAELDLAMAEALVHAGLAHDARLEAQAAADTFTELHVIEGTSQARLVAGVAALTVGDLDTAMPEIELAERLVSSRRHRHEMALVRLGELLGSHARDVPERARRLTTIGQPSNTTFDDPVMLAVADLAAAFASPTDAPAQRALDSARRGIDLHDLEGLDVVRAVVAAHVMRRRGDLGGAVAQIVTALTRASSPRAQLQGAYRPLTHLYLVGVADGTLLDLLLEIDTPDSVTEAWRWAAVTKARSLTDLASTQANTHQPWPTTPLLPVHRERELTRLSATLDQLIRPDGDVDLAAIRATHVAVRRDIRQQIPQARLPLTPEGRVDLPPVPEGPVLQLHVLGPDLVAFVVREGQVYARRLLDATGDVTSFVAEWHAECSRVQRLEGHGAGSGLHHSLEALGMLLLNPVADLLEDLEGLPLVLVAPGQLQAVPFEALPFLGTSFAAAFSLRFAAGMHDLGSVCRLDDEDVDPESSLLALMVPDETTPRIADETQALASIHPGATILSGARASVDALSHLGRRHDLVHIACHGLYWPDHPSSSGLRLGDRWVTAGEILRMDLSGSLVVLNACATGRAHDTTSESIGLTWALLAAGARGVVATTWPVDDAVALAFARSFHQHLKDGEPTAQAVRLAGFDVSQEFSDHPWAWAAHRYVAAGATILHEG